MLATSGMGDSGQDHPPQSSCRRVLGPKLLQIPGDSQMVALFVGFIRPTENSYTWQSKKIRLIIIYMYQMYSII